MLREEVYRSYEVNGSGMITTPGKFEFEPVWAPHLWEGVLEGCSEGDFDDEDGNHVSVIYPTGEDIAEYPELAGIACVYLWETDQGFVYTQVFHAIPNWELSATSTAVVFENPRRNE